MWAEEAVPRLQALGLGASVGDPDVSPGRHRRVTGRRAARRGDAPGDQSDRRHVRPGRGGRRPDLGRRGRDDVGRGAGRIGGQGRRGQARQIRLGEGRDDLERRDRGPPRRARLDARGGRDRHRRQRGRRCSATPPGCAWTNRSPPRPRPRPPTGPTTARRQGGRRAARQRERPRALCASGARARWGGRRPGRREPFARVATWRCRSRSCSPSAERHVRRVVFLAGGMGRSRAALAAAAVLLEVLGETLA